MDPQKLLEAPKPQPKIVARVSKVNNLVKVSSEARKTSTKLRKTFEKGLYQRKTQLSVLNRYKKRLDGIQKEKDKAYQKQTKKKPEKVKIPKFKGTFFSKSGDPLLQIAALAGINSLEKLLEGDLLGALSPAMVAAGALMAPGLLGLAGGAIEGFFGRGPKPQRGFDVNGRRVRTSSQNRYRQRYGDKAFKNRFGKDALKRSRQGGDVAKAVTKGGRAARAFGKFGSAIIPGVGAVVGAADAAIRTSEGDYTGAWISGAGASLDAAAAASAATGIGLPVAGLLSIASFALDVTNLTRDLLGASDSEIEKNKRLKEQTAKEKQLSKAKGDLTFTKTLDSYSTALVKFEKFSKEFTKGLFMTPDQVEIEAARVESTGAGSNPISGAGYGFTQKESFSQYLTGDPSSPAYDAAHGTVSNYHDHVAFKDRATMQRAAAYLQSKGIEVTEMNVSSGHTPGSAHYDGRAFDVPGSQWGGSGAIGPTEYNGSKRVRALLNEFYEAEGSHGGNILYGPKEGYFALLHGREAVLPIDNQHTQSGGDPMENVSPEILNLILNKSKRYQMAMTEMPPEVIEVPMPVSMPQAPQVQYASSAPLNIQDDADKKLLRMLYYSAVS